MQAGSRYVLRWPDQPEPSTVSVTLISPSKLKILSVDFSPKSPRARVDLVRAVVTIGNEGGSDSRDFVVTWTPGPNDPVQSATVPNLVAGETKRVELPAYTYKTHGTFQTAIIVGNGSDSYHDTLTASPYAINPHSQNVPMRDQWPDPGGEKGITKDFPVQPILLGQDCVIDTTRGGGSFDVEDIDDPNKKYTIAWPAGYDFNFGGDVFWRSLSSVGANFDAQARLVNAVVTLKGLGGHVWPFPIRGPERFQGDFTVYSLCPT
jgi:hypothetical protein